MNEQEFLERYGDKKVYFSNIYKFKITFKNEELKIWRGGILDYRDDLSKEETVISIFNLDCFEFGFIT